MITLRIVSVAVLALAGSLPAALEYYNCAPGVYCRAAFQGNNLVYVAAQP